MAHDHQDDSDFLDLPDLARLCGMEPDHILEYSRTSVITLHSSGDSYHADAHTLRRLRRISSLRHEHGLSFSATGYVLDLLDRLETLEKELRELRERL